MRKSQHSSGDLVVDRRGTYAEALASEQDYAAAAEVMEQALQLAPDWAAGWNNLGRYREDAGDLAGAFVAWRRSAALDPDGQYGAALKLVAYGEASAARSEAYVETLFDNYASRFETSLVDRLGYHIPEQLGQLLIGQGPVAVGLDLGCGTGLMGREMRGMVRRLEGVDISGEMLAEARRKGIYDRLTQGELMGFLAGWYEAADLVTATDVLNYLGALPPVLAAVRRVLGEGGRFGFSLETHAGPEALLLRPTLRYAHSPDAARTACDAAGFDIVTQRAVTIRMDRGLPVEGLLLVLRRR